MQADAGFVEDVGHADEPEAELRGQADALGFAAGERAALAVEGEVVQAGVVEEREALLEATARLFGGHDAGMRGELLREFQRGGNRHRQELRHRLAVEAQREGRRGEAAPLAAGADGARLELQQALAERFAGGGTVGVLEFGEHARPDGLHGLTALGRREQELTFRVAVQKQVTDGLGEVAPRGLEVERHLLGERAGDGVAADERLARGALPRLHDAVVDRQGLVADG